jgi:hypothetical protein
MASARKLWKIYRPLPIIAGLAGLASFCYGLVLQRAWMVGIGAFVMLLGFAFPRLKGRIEIALGALKFKGELIHDPDPEESDEEETRPSEQ